MVFKLIGYFLYFLLFGAAIVAFLAALAFGVACAFEHKKPTEAAKYLLGKDN